MNSGLIISGGNTAEVFVPSTGQNCQLPEIPGASRIQHTMEKMILCGGSNAMKSCITFMPDLGTWQTTTSSLQKSRWFYLYKQSDPLVRMNTKPCRQIIFYALACSCLSIFIIRYQHASWASPSGIILMGGLGFNSESSTEKIGEDGTSTNSFDLKHKVL